MSQGLARWQPKTTNFQNVQNLKLNLKTNPKRYHRYLFWLVYVWLTRTQLKYYWNIFKICKTFDSDSRTYKHPTQWYMFGLQLCSLIFFYWYILIDIYIYQTKHICLVCIVCCKESPGLQSSCTTALSSYMIYIRKQYLKLTMYNVKKYIKLTISKVNNV